MTDTPKNWPEECDADGCSYSPSFFVHDYELVDRETGDIEMWRKLYFCYLHARRPQLYEDGTPVSPRAITTPVQFDIDPLPLP